MVSSSILTALAELRAQRQALDDQRKALDEAITALERVVPPSEQQHKLSSFLTLGVTPPSADADRINHGNANRFSNLTIPEAAKRYLREVGRPLTNREIADGLVEGGFKHESDDFVNTIGSILRRFEMQRGELVRHENRWYLPEFLSDKQV